MVSRVRNSAGHQAFLLVFPLAFLLSGCINIERTVTRQSSTACSVDSNSQKALQNIRARAQLSMDTFAETCRKAENYHCNKRVFHPGATDGRSTQRECVFLNSLSANACLDLEVLTYSTAEASQSSDTRPEDVAAGGMYNYSEYNCHNKEIKESGTFLVVGRAEQLDQAMEAALRVCLEI